MFPFWDVAIAPVFDAVGARRVAEIGALRGETTVLMLDRLGPDAELHVIDPVPEFDPAEHEARFGGRYIFHRDLSLNVIADLPPVDVALIDGDHNWYTVYHELHGFTNVARAAGAPLPVFICHDVGWPYGRRDLYYAPEQIPPEHRQPYAQAGIRPGRAEVMDAGGLNPTMYNARTEGGPRNGVMTAIDDYVADHTADHPDNPLRVLVLPIYFGLAIITDQATLDTHPALGALLDRLEDRDGQRDLLHLAEDTRIAAMLFQHNVFYHRETQLQAAADRYLDLLKTALLDQHHLDNELRIHYLLTCLEESWTPSMDILGDPERQMRDNHRRLIAGRTAGRQREHGFDASSALTYTGMGRTRLDHLQTTLDTIRTEEIAGDLVECGTDRGGSAIFLRGYLRAHDIKGRKVFVADRFGKRRPAPDAPPDAAGAAPDRQMQSPGELSVGWTGSGLRLPGMTTLTERPRPDLDDIREGFKRFGLFDVGVRFLKGGFADSLPDAPIETIALLRIGTGLGRAASEALDHAYERVAPGGFVVIDDYQTPACRKAVDEFRARRGIEDRVERIDWAAAYWRKESGPTTETVGAVEASPTELVATGPDTDLTVTDLADTDLTVIVTLGGPDQPAGLELERTLHSLSRTYQREIENLSYEVIVVGPAAHPALASDLVREFGPEYRALPLAVGVAPSPANALAAGLGVARGRHLAFLIDPTHVLSPGVVRSGVSGLESYAPTVVATQRWQVGADEGDPFVLVAWPVDGYRMFDVGHSIGGRDWLDGPWDTTCLFVTRALVDQVGHVDERFYEKLASVPDLAVTTPLGEATFAAPTDSPAANAIVFPIADPPSHYVGTMFHEARLTRPRRHRHTELFRNASSADPDGPAERPAPIPEELQLEFTDAYWRGLGWQETRWLGTRIPKSPADLFAYQEIVSRVRPDWIIETGSGNGGRALFLASICELVGHGHVLSIDVKDDPARIQHPRVTYLQGKPFDPEIQARIAELVGPEPHALGVVGTQARRLRVIMEFEALMPFIPVDSYIVVEETIVNGHPVWATFGPGPSEGVRQLGQRHPEFIPDTSLERFTLSFNPNGFLRRIR